MLHVRLATNQHLPTVSQQAMAIKATERPATAQQATERPATAHRATELQATTHQATERRATAIKAIERQAMETKATERRATEDRTMSIRARATTSNQVTGTEPRKRSAMAQAHLIKRWPLAVIRCSKNIINLIELASDP